MNALLANQAIDLAIAGILSAFAVFITSIAGYVQLRTKQAAQAAQLDAVQKQQDKQAAPGPTTVVAMPTAPNASPPQATSGGPTCPVCGAPFDQPVTAPAPGPRS